MGYSIGIGLTNNCNLDCAHCYRPTDRVYNLSLDQIKTICASVPVDAMGMGTGENYMHPQFVEIVDYLSAQGIKLNAIGGQRLRAVTHYGIEADDIDPQRGDCCQRRPDLVSLDVMSLAVVQSITLWRRGSHEVQNE